MHVDSIVRQQRNVEVEVEAEVEGDGGVVERSDSRVVYGSKASLSRVGPYLCGSMHVSNCFLNGSNVCIIIMHSILKILKNSVTQLRRFKFTNLEKA